MIVCVHAPFFAISIEETEISTTDAPLVIVEQGKRVVQVVSASPSAFRAGVRAGMRLRQAQIVCPELKSVSKRPSLYRHKVYEVCERLLNVTDKIELETSLWNTHRQKSTMRVQTQGILLYLDIGEINEDGADRLRKEIETCFASPLYHPISLGIAQHKFTSCVAARIAKLGERVTIKRGGDAAFLFSYPITFLPLEPEMARRLFLLGIRTIGTFASLPIGAVHAQFGSVGKTLHELARGIDRRSIACFLPYEERRVARSFEDVIEDREMLLNVLEALTDELGEMLQSSLLSTRSLRLTISLENKVVRERELSLRRRIQDIHLLKRMMVWLFEGFSFPCGVTKIEVAIADLVPVAAKQLELFPSENGAETQLEALLEDMTERYGANAVIKMRLSNRPSWMPEHRFETIGLVS